MNSTRRTNCRSCGAERLRPFLDIGPMPLVNAFLRSTEDVARERSFPLLVCLCEGCSLVQTPDVVPKEVLFREYTYLSGVSSSMFAHFHGLARRVVEHLGLVPTDRVVEIASNDGTLLECFRAEGVRTLGVEPAAEIAERARRKGIETVSQFFDGALAKRICEEHGGSRAVVATNVLAHVDRPVEFLQGVRTLLDGSPGESVVVEVPYVGDMFERVAFDTIYHEHLSYFSASALLRLFERAGFAVDAIDRVPVHLGSLRVWASPARAPRPHAPAVLEFAEREKQEGLTGLARALAFARDVEASKAALVALLERLRGEGAKIAACGAPAKGNVLLNACKIGTRLVEYAVDKSPLKVGTLTPGMHLPVLPPATLLERKPDYALLLVWNLEEEMRTEHAQWLAGGGRFILPLPRAEIRGPLPIAGQPGGARP